MIWTLLLIALTVALEPLPLTGYILVLSTPNGPKKGLGFLLGWVLSLVVVTVVTLLLTGGKPVATSSAPSTAGLAVRMAIGAWLLWVAWHRRATRGQPRPEPGWTKRVDKINFVGAMVLAFLLQPWGLVAAGVATVMQANLESAASVLGVVLFCLVGTSSYITMETYALVSPEAAMRRLDGIRGWINTHRDQAIILLSLGLGFYLLANSAYLISTGQ